MENLANSQVSVGTPPQQQVVILDTGSSDLYFDATDAASCKSTTDEHSCRGGTFTPSSSSTYKEVEKSPSFNASFGDGSAAIGPYGTDNVQIGDVLLEGLQFGVAEITNSTAGYALGLIGIGYDQGEATSTAYVNLPDALIDSGVTNSRLFSLYLGDAVTGSGNILFGGVDTAKYTGSMTTFDMLPDYYTGIIDRYITTITDLTVTVGGKTQTIFSGGKNDISAYKSTSTAAIALLDSGSAAWTVPSGYFNAIAKVFSYIDEDGNCPCSYRWGGDTMKLTFGGKQDITVSAQEFIVPIFDETTNKPITDGKGNDLCTFLVGPSEPGDEILPVGDGVLRSMYIVYDMDNAQLSIAQAAPNATDSKPVAVPAGPGGLASVVSGLATAKPTTSLLPGFASGTAVVASTAQSTLGIATGIDAEPTAARPAVTPSNASGAAASASKSGAATKSVVGPFQWGGILSIGWMMCMTVAGASLLL